MRKNHGRSRRRDEVLDVAEDRVRATRGEREAGHEDDDQQPRAGARARRRRARSGGTRGEHEHDAVIAAKATSCVATIESGDELAREAHLADGRRVLERAPRAAWSEVEKKTHGGRPRAGRASSGRLGRLRLPEHREDDEVDGMSAAGSASVQASPSTEPLYFARRSRGRGCRTARGSGAGRRRRSPGAIVGTARPSPARRRAGGRGAKRKPRCPIGSSGAPAADSQRRGAARARARGPPRTPRRGARGARSPSRGTPSRSRTRPRAGGRRTTAPRARRGAASRAGSPRSRRARRRSAPASPAVLERARREDEVVAPLEQRVVVVEGDLG